MVCVLTDHFLCRFVRTQTEVRKTFPADFANFADDLQMEKMLLHQYPWSVSSQTILSFDTDRGLQSKTFRFCVRDMEGLVHLFVCFFDANK
jgi:hypothetical protein